MQLAVDNRVSGIMDASNDGSRSPELRVNTAKVEDESKEDSNETEDA